ncbi:MAG: PKD domain-containing protein [Verrucomicrobiales bacterium]|nr:PKD domain-containing protein [Verrucomicrobiales bacterium]
MASSPAPTSINIGDGQQFARQRREELAHLIVTAPHRALALAITDEVRATLPASIQEWLEHRIDARGDLEVLCALPDPSSSVPAPSVQRFAIIQGQRYRATVAGTRLGLSTRRNIRLQGIAIDGTIALSESSAEPTAQDESDIAATPAPAVPPDEAPRRRLILIRVDFSDLVGESFSTNRAVQLVRELHRFFQENSYGRAGFMEIGQGSTVTEVFRLPRTATSYGNGDDAVDLRTDARAAASEAGYDLSAYDNDIICLGSVPGFGWAGLGFVNSTGAWIRGTSSSGVTAHELGHNLGLNHANFWDTGGQTIIGPGSSIEYGDKFDTMGSAVGGRNHFNARSKRWLGWLQPGEFSVATTNGIYRIHAHDQTNAVNGSRGLQVFASARTNYWMEFRRQFTNNAWLMHGAGLRWTGRANEASLLLDATPGSAGEKDDTPILLGRTFSDRLAGIHLTPLRIGSGPPDWIEVAVYRGTFPLNRPPTASLNAPLLAGATSQSFLFEIIASDPDGDELAYFWEFGDNSPSENLRTLSHRWSTTGDYRVRCTVSDRKGGATRLSTTVRVGSPSTLRLSGRIFADGAPVSGVRVSVGQGRFDISDVNGAYQITGLSRGTYTATAIAEDGVRFEPLGFANPIQATTSLEDLHFVQSDVVATVPTTLIAAGSIWRYWDQGTAPLGNWKIAGFEDSAWNEGAAILGYGGDRETTVIGFGPQNNQKFVTAWFRREFVVDDPTRFAALKMELLRDDGAVLYLNGQEIIRDNMPAGTITATTLAASTIGGTDETTYFEHPLDHRRLVLGTNVLAAEVHQSSRSSSDTAFDLRLIADLAETVPDGIRLVRPFPDERFTAPARVVLSVATSELNGQRPARVTFQVDRQEIGGITQPPFVLSWNASRAGDHELTAVAEFPDGTVVTTDPVRIVILDPALTPLFVSRGSSWRYLESRETPPVSWNQSPFDDSDWPEGPARLGYGEDGEFTVLPLAAAATSKPITTWFRHRFDVRDAASVTNLIYRLQRDDGAAVYLNGVEQFRLGLRAGELSHTTTAQSDIREGAEQAFTERSLPPSALVEGPNTIAVEVHQFSATNTDLGFDLELAAQRAHPPVVPLLQWQVANGLLEISWSAAFSGWRLEIAPSIPFPVSWQAVTGAPKVSDDRITFTVPVQSTSSFFRLSSSTAQ